MVTKEALEEYKKIYKKHTGKNISDEEAIEQATKLLRVVELIYKPMTQEDLDRVNKRREELGGNGEILPDKNL